MKLFLLCLQISATSTSMTHRFRSCKCASYNETVMKLDVCHLKAYSRKLVTLNVGFTTFYPFVKPYLVSLKFLFRTSMPTPEKF